MHRLSEKALLDPLLKLKDVSQWVTDSEVLEFHINSSFKKDKALTLGFSNCSCQETRSTFRPPL